VEHNASFSKIQELLIKALDDIGMTQRRFAEEFPDYSTATYGNWRRMVHPMGLDVVEKILSKYPEIRKIVAQYLSGNTEENSKNITTGSNQVKKEDTHKEKDVRKATLMRIYQLQQDVALRDEIIADLQKSLDEAGIIKN
jgi:hypothetical protein